MIKRLAGEYFLLNRGELIEKHEELLRIADIRGIQCSRHPHRTYRVYISRRSLKHFVEERKAAFLVNHSEEDTMEAILFGIDMIPDAIIDYDRHEHEPKHMPPKHFYLKDYSHLGRPSLRILVEEKKTWLEIRSIHFQTRDRMR